MAHTCKKCSNEIPELNFTEDQKLEIWGLAAQNMKIFLVSKLIHECKMSHSDAKVVAMHIHCENGHCVKCNFKNLTGENVECPKCHAFNYNFDEPPFNREFCTHLEWKLDFDELDMEELTGFWCDGVDHLPADIKSLTKSKIREHQEIVTKAWIGREGENHYEMIIRLGEQAIANYMGNLSLVPTIPDENQKKWIQIEPKNQRIIIQLQ